MSKNPEKSEDPKKPEDPKKLKLSGRDYRYIMNLGASADLDLAQRAMHHEHRRRQLSVLQTSTGRLPVYPYSKGLNLVNDGVAYGELLVERRVIIESKGNMIRTFDSVRTRTGKQPLSNGKNAGDQDT